MLYVTKCSIWWCPRTGSVRFFRGHLSSLGSRQCVTKDIKLNIKSPIHRTHHSRHLPHIFPVRSNLPIVWQFSRCGLLLVRISSSLVCNFCPSLVSSTSISHVPYWYPPSTFSHSIHIKFEILVLQGRNTPLKCTLQCMDPSWHQLISVGLGVARG